MKSTEPSQDQIDTLVALFQSGELTKTQVTCQQILESFPRSVVVTNILAVALHRQGNLANAIEIYDRLIELNSKYPDAYNNRGVAFSDQGNWEAAITSFNKAIELNPEYAEAYNNRGIAQRHQGQMEAAVDSYDHAIRLNPGFADAYNNRATALRYLGQLNEAMESCHKAIEIRPDHAEAHYSLSLVKKYSADDDQIGLMERIFPQTESRDADRIHLCFALAKAYDDLERYEDCIEYLILGNRLHKENSGYDLDHESKNFECLRSIFTHHAVEPVVTSDDPSAVQSVFIVGMPRSGTSLVEQILANHSKVHGAGELPDLDQLSRHLLSQLNAGSDQPDFESLLRAGMEDLGNAYTDALQKLQVAEGIITDKLPGNFLWTGFILAAFSSAKIVNVRRNPVATCWSIYKTLFTGSSIGYGYDFDDLIVYYHLYEDLMSFWKDLFPGRIYELDYEALTENPSRETHNLLAYCDLDWEPECLDFHTSKRHVVTASTTQVRNEIYRGSSEAWRHYEHRLGPLVEGLKNRPKTKSRN